MDFLRFMRFMLRLVGGGFMVVGVLGSIGGLFLMANPEFPMQFNGVETTDVWPKVLFTSLFVAQGVAGWAMTAYGPGFLLGFIERARMNRHE